ncbi:MAG: riboflavin synthase [Gemmatimonadales bacterium]
MFSGLVSAIGTVKAAKRTARGLAVTIAAPYPGLAVGESVAVDGACLTVVARGTGTFTVEAIGTTRGRTKIGDYRAGTAVNLERALRVSDRLGGHLVSGHVDAVGRVVRRREAGDALLLDVRVPAAVSALCVPHGSITVDGVSLTINALPARGVVQVALIPHTRRVTTLGAAGLGARVHLEADLVGKFVRQLVQPHRATRRRR